MKLPPSEYKKPLTSEPRGHENVSVDIWAVLRTHKGVALGTFFIILSLGAVMSFTPTPLYEGQVTVEIGEQKGTGWVERPATVAKWFRLKYIKGKFLSASAPHLISVQYRPESEPGVITLRAGGENRNQIQDLLINITNSLFKRHRPIYDDFMTIQRFRLGELSDRIDYLQENLEEWVKSMQKMPSDLIFVASIERRNLLQHIKLLQKEREGIKLVLLKSIPTRLIHDVIIFPEPVRPKPTLYMMISLLIGAILSVSAAVSLELFLRSRQKIRER